MATFSILHDSVVTEYTDYHSIPPVFDNVISAVFDYLDPVDGDDHSVYQHAVMDNYDVQLQELMITERTQDVQWDTLYNLSLSHTDEQMSTAISDWGDSIDLNRGAYIAGGYYASSM